MGRYVLPSPAGAAENVPGAMRSVDGHIASPVAGQVVADKLFHFRPFTCLPQRLQGRDQVEVKPGAARAMSSRPPAVPA
jgi:hypothetical protein